MLQAIANLGMPGVDARPSAKRAIAGIVSGIIAVCFIGWFDWSTGIEISFSIFYLLPIGLSVWIAGRNVGIIISFLAAGVWMSLDLEGGSRYSSPLIPAWNALVRFGFFVLTTFLLSRVRLLTSNLQVLVSEGAADLVVEARQRQIFAHAIESTAEMICITDLADHITYINRAFEKGFQYHSGEILGKTADILLAPTNPAGMNAHLLQETKSGGWQGELTCARKNGQEFPVVLSTSVIKDHARNPIGFIRVAKDITERKRAAKQAAVLNSLSQELGAANEERAAAQIILRIASDLFQWDAAYLHLYSSETDTINPILTVDTQDGARFEISPQFFSLEPTPLMRRIMREGPMLFERRPATVEPALMSFGNVERRSAAMMYVPLRSTGVCLGVLSLQSYTPGVYNQNDLSLLQALADQCGDALLRIKLSSDIAEISQREQQRIAHDLHDHLGAFLAGAAFRMKALAQKLERNNVPEAAEAAQLVSVVNNSIDQVRNFARLLASSEIASDGLEKALRRLASEMNTLFGVECVVQTPAQVPPLTEEQTSHLYRIAQEAARNAVQHGCARTVEIRVASDANGLALSISNDGLAWDPKNVSDNKLGLRIMRYRAGVIGGSLDLQPQRDGRITVVCQLPLKNENNSP